MAATPDGAKRIKLTMTAAGAISGTLPDDYPFEEPRVPDGTATEASPDLPPEEVLWKPAPWMDGTKRLGSGPGSGGSEGSGGCGGDGGGC
jgi:hypothetical protein